MTIVALSKDEQDSAFVDPWTVVHFSVGLALGLLEVSAAFTMIVSTIHEIIELRPQAMKFFKSTPESVGNVVIDMASVMGGWWLGDKYAKSGTKPKALNPARPPRSMPARPRAAAALPRDRSPGVTQRQFQRAIIGRP